MPASRPCRRPPPRPSAPLHGARRPRRVAGPGRLRPEPRARARHDAALRHRRAGARGHARGLALLPLAQHRRARRAAAGSSTTWRSRPTVRASSTARTSTTGPGRRSRCPSNWQLQGYDKPIYLNTRYPWAPENPQPPTIPPDYNPVGSYRTTFEVPAAWAGRRVFLHFAGVNSAFHLWVNGRWVGYSEDSMTAAEFDVTPFLKAGENLLAAQVFRWSDGSYLEDQDTWRLSGIYRDVFLYSTPALRISDFAVRTDLDEAYRDATLLVRPRLRSHDGATAEGFTVEAQLFDADRRPVLAQPLARDAKAILDEKYPQRDTNPFGLLEAKVKAPRLWSAETPYLYTLVLSLKDPKGAVVQATSARVGFREVEVRGERLLLNGRPIRFYGVDRHEHDPDHGQAVPYERMVQDVELMKQTTSTRCGPATTRTTRGGTSCATATASTCWTRRTSRPTASPGGSPTTRSGCRPSWSAPGGWWSATRTTPRSSCGRSATSRGWARTTPRWRGGSARTTRPGPSTTRARRMKPRDPAWVDVVSRMYTRIPELGEDGEGPSRHAPGRPVRVRLRPRQRGREPEGVLGPHRVGGPAPRRLHLGLGGQGAAQARRPGPRVLGLRRRLRGRAQRRHDGLQRHRAARPPAGAGALRGREGLPADRHDGGGRGGGADPGPERATTSATSTSSRSRGVSSTTGGWWTRAGCRRPPSGRSRRASCGSP